ncbi:MAG: hypothetical protein IKH86_00810 [Prevotella sp.]|jgi:L-asparagine transporter-like permease|nr:hypothetical protein [Prevotella sp.]
MEKRKIVNYCNLGGFALYVVGRFAKIPAVAIAGLVLIVIAMFITLFNRKEFTNFEFWLAIAVLAIFAVAIILLFTL